MITLGSFFIIWRILNGKNLKERGISVKDDRVFGKLGVNVLISVD